MYLVKDLQNLLLWLGITALVDRVNCSYVYCNSSMASNNTEMKVALIRAPPPNWPLPLGTHNWTGIQLNVSQNVDEGIRLIEEAKASGADLVTFPELWFPG